MSNIASAKASAILSIETGRTIGRCQARADLAEVLCDLPHEEMPEKLMQKIFDAMEAKRVEREKS